MDNVIALRNPELELVIVPAAARVPAPIDESALLDPGAWYGFAMSWKLADKMAARDKHDASTIPG